MKRNQKELIIHETKTHLNRWTQETDLDDEEIVKAYMVAINEWLDRIDKNSKSNIQPPVL